MAGPRDESANVASANRGYVVAAIVAGAACAVVALLHLPGIWYAIVGVVLGLTYALLVVTGRNTGSGHNRNRR